MTGRSGHLGPTVRRQPLEMTDHDDRRLRVHRAARRMDPPGSLNQVAPLLSGSLVAGLRAGPRRGRAHLRRRAGERSATKEKACRTKPSGVAALTGLPHVAGHSEAGLRLAGVVLRREAEAVTPVDRARRRAAAAGLARVDLRHVRGHSESGPRVVQAEVVPRLEVEAAMRVDQARRRVAAAAPARVDLRRVRDHSKAGLRAVLVEVGPRLAVLAGVVLRRAVEAATPDDRARLRAAAAGLARVDRRRVRGHPEAGPQVVQAEVVLLRVVEAATPDDRVHRHVAAADRVRVDRRRVQAQTLVAKAEGLVLRLDVRARPGDEAKAGPGLKYGGDLLSHWRVRRQVA